MTASVIEAAAEPDEEALHQARCTISVDGAYAARLVRCGPRGQSPRVERWTLDGPEPYAVALPGERPESPGAEVLPLSCGRVLVHRVTAGLHGFSLLYPSGPITGEVPLGALESPALRLLPPVPGGRRAYALAVGERTSSVWLVAGGGFGPEKVAELPGRCSGGVWLDRTERLLALDLERDGLTKTVAVDLEREGEFSPLLQITEDSTDRLLLADIDSGLLLIRSDAASPGHERLAWGVLGSTLPVRFPDCLRPPDRVITPFAIQPGQVLTPERCAVALRVDGAAGTWIGVWRPAERTLRHFPAPEGWLTGTGLWTSDGALRLPYTNRQVNCGVARLQLPAPRGAADRVAPPTAARPPRSVPAALAPERPRTPAAATPTAPEHIRTTPERSRTAPEHSRTGPEPGRNPSEGARPAEDAVRTRPAAERPRPATERPRPVAERPRPAAGLPGPGAEHPGPAAHPGPGPEGTGPDAERLAPSAQGVPPDGERPGPEDVRSATAADPAGFRVAHQASHAHVPVHAAPPATALGEGEIRGAVNSYRRATLSPQDSPGTVGGDSRRPVPLQEAPLTDPTTAPA